MRLIIISFLFFISAIADAQTALNGKWYSLGGGPTKVIEADFEDAVSKSSLLDWDFKNPADQTNCRIIKIIRQNDNLYYIYVVNSISAGSIDSDSISISIISSIKQDSSFVMQLLSNNQTYYKDTSAA